jgi:hypothetical protein
MEDLCRFLEFSQTVREARAGAVGAFGTVPGCRMPCVSGTMKRVDLLIGQVSNAIFAE